VDLGQVYGAMQGCNADPGAVGVGGTANPTQFYYSFEVLDHSILPQVIEDFSGDADTVSLGVLADRFGFLVTIFNSTDTCICAQAKNGTWISQGSIQAAYDGASFSLNSTCFSLPDCGNTVTGLVF